MKLYSTTDVAASTRRALADFTHVVLNRAMWLHKPIIFDSRTVVDLPAFLSSKALPQSEQQVREWKKHGGVLFVMDTHFTPGGQDVTVMVECPYTMQRLAAVNVDNAEYGVIPNPVSWTAYDEEVDLRNPPVSFLQDIWFHCGGRNMSLDELSQASGWPVAQVGAMMHVLKPVEYWYIEKRLKPERSELIPAYAWLEGGAVPRREITKSGFKPAVWQLARFGYISMKRLQHFPSETPNWRQLQKDREAALKDLSAVRLLVESLPDHLEALSPSDESL